MLNVASWLPKVKLYFPPLRHASFTHTKPRDNSFALILEPPEPLEMLPVGVVLCRGHAALSPSPIAPLVGNGDPRRSLARPWLTIGKAMACGWQLDGSCGGQAWALPTRTLNPEFNATKRYLHCLYRLIYGLLTKCSMFCSRLWLIVPRKGDSREVDFEIPRPLIPAAKGKVIQ